MTTPVPSDSSSPTPSPPTLPSAVAVATHAVTLLEDNPLFNAGHGAVFTRDGTNELEASIMVSRGHAKRGVGVSGLRHVRNPILLARAMLERGDEDLAPRPRGRTTGVGEGTEGVIVSKELDVPSAQGHTHLHGASAEQLAKLYDIPLVPTSYFFTQRRWDEHIRGLERERAAAAATCHDGKGCHEKKSQEEFVSASWSKDEYLPQGTVGAIALDTDGVVCCATSTGGLTNKLSGRIGDTPTVGAGFWAEEWFDPVVRDGQYGGEAGGRASPGVVLAGALKVLVADCLPTPWMYSPVSGGGAVRAPTRSVAVSGTGNGDSFLRTAAARTVGSIARYAGLPSAVALKEVAGPGGELQKSAGGRWGCTGEGEGGMIGIECVVVRDGWGNVVEARSEILQNFNCGGMFRAWVDDKGVAFVRVFREDGMLPAGYEGEGKPEDPRAWFTEMLG